MLNTPVLVLNASYEPISITSARKAVRLVLKGIAETEALSGRSLRSGRTSFPLPSVIRLRVYRDIPRRANVVTRKNIFMRDRFTCQYCKRRLLSNSLTLDHVIPQSRGGKSDWGNLVACCKPCNNKKGNQTPEEAGLTLPKRSLYSVHTSRHLVRQAGEDNEDWRKYLFY
jgi:5-methylcytosine-specific restriction endonuclease McrA